jgi:DNA-binding response OmpR family regulator
VPTILVASDAPTVRAEIAAIAGSPDTTIVEARSGPEVMVLVSESMPDLVIVDMQMGNMGGMATTLELRLEASYDKLAHVPVLMLLDRRPDVFLARRSGAEGFLVKPLDPQRLRSAVRALLRGEEYEDESLRPATVRVGSADIQ